MQNIYFVNNYIVLRQTKYKNIMWKTKKMSNTDPIENPG